MGKIIRKTFVGAPVKKAEGDGAEKPSIVFVASDSTPDSFSDRVMVKGMDLARFQANPTLLWSHDHRIPAIGTAKVWVEGEGEAAKLMMEPQFSQATQLARDVAAAVAEGTIKACSVGMRIKAGGMQENERGGYDFNASELLGISICNVPANPSAVRVKAIDEAEASAFEELSAKVDALAERVSAIETKAAEPATTEAPAVEPAKAHEPEPETDFQRALAALLTSSK